jgi:hypothetical protein
MITAVGGSFVCGRVAEAGINWIKSIQLWRRSRLGFLAG